MQIQLSWTDAETGSPRSPVLSTPIALGREFVLMPSVMEGQRVSRMVLSDDRVEPYHALIVERAGELLITSHGNAEVSVNGVVLPSSTLIDGDHIQLGPFQIQVRCSVEQPSPSASGRCNRMVGFLFKRRCDRTSSVGCPYCNQEHEENDSYFYEHRWYSNYGSYHSGQWGYSYYHDRDCYSYNPDTRNVDFTEADSAAFTQEGEIDYEQDVGAS